MKSGDSVQNEEFGLLIKNSPFLLAYFSFEGCQVCKVLKPKVQELLKNFTEFEFLYIDTDEHPVLKGQYLVFTVPTIIIFQEGRELKRFSRHISLVTLEDYLQNIGVQ